MGRSKLLIYLFLFLRLNISLLGTTKITYDGKVHRRVPLQFTYNFEKKKCSRGQHSRENIRSEINIT